MPLRPVTTPNKSRYRCETASGTIFINFVDPTGREHQEGDPIGKPTRPALIEAGGKTYASINGELVEVNPNDYQIQPGGGGEGVEEGSYFDRLRRDHPQGQVFDDDSGSERQFVDTGDESLNDVVNKK